MPCQVRSTKQASDLARGSNAANTRSGGSDADPKATPPVGHRIRPRSPVSAHVGPRGALAARLATSATRPADPGGREPSPLVELHDRQSTPQLAMSNGAPPAASGTT